MEMPKNYSAVLLGRKPTDYIAGEDIELKPLVASWDNLIVGSKYKLEHELQRPFDFETYACTVFSGNDVKEPLMMFAIDNYEMSHDNIDWLYKSGYFRNGYINFDDRIPAMHAEIENGLGTYQYKAGDALRKWSLPEGILKDVPKNWDEYMDKNRITEDVYKLQAEFDKRFVWNWYWFTDQKPIEEQLKSSPAMSIVKYADGDGCLRPEGNLNHAVMEYGRTEQGCARIDDNYNRQLKKYDPKYIGGRIGFRLTIKNNFIPMQIKDNKLYLLVEGKEQKLAMGLDGKLWVYDEKIDTLLNSLYRNGTLERPKTVTLEEWNTATKVNGKGEPIK